MIFLKMFLHCHKLKIARKYVVNYYLVLSIKWNQKEYAINVYVNFYEVSCNIKKWRVNNVEKIILDLRLM